MLGYYYYRRLTDKQNKVREIKWPVHVQMDDHSKNACIALLQCFKYIKSFHPYDNLVNCKETEAY